MKWMVFDDMVAEDSRNTGACGKWAKQALLRW
jgi:hypothetical protein